MFPAARDWPPYAAAGPFCAPVGIWPQVHGGAARKEPGHYCLPEVAMKTLLLSLACAVWGTAAVLAAPQLKLEDTVTFPDLKVPQGQAAEVTLPALPLKPGQITVLSFRAVIVTRGPGGCNWNLQVQLNGQTPGRHTADGGERMVGRAPSLELLAGGLGFPVFSGDKLMVMFAADTAQGDSMAADGLGATFNFDVTDLARGVDGNTVTFRNATPGKMDEGLGHLQVTDLRVGYLDRSALPKIPSMAPKRGRIGQCTQKGVFQIGQAKGGGFSVSVGDQEMLVETALGMKAATPAALVADDGTTGGVPFDDAQGLRQVPALQPLPGKGMGIIADWPGLRLERTLDVRDGLLWWHDRWTNTGSEVRGVPFRYRMFLRDKLTRFTVGGSTDNAALVSSASNPTLFLQPIGAGNGFGITGENDWLRLLAGWRGMSDLGEVYSQWLALHPGKSIDLELSITPVTDGGGYWSFINGVRRRWDVSKATMPAPMFWGFARAAGADQPEIIRKSLAHLGPIIVCLGPWQRLEPDARVVTAGKYPKLPPDAPRAPGLSPDLDIAAFLTFKHREPYWDNVKSLTQLIHDNVPGAKVIEMIHPSMETIYKPLQDKWPIAPDAIKTAQGTTFEAANYSRSWLGTMTQKDWGVLYYSPHDGGPQLRAILDGIIRGMDDCRLDGIYSDEFSWAFARGYSRYDYSRQDGYSADLDEEGKVTRLKCDNAYVSEPSQLQITGEVLRRGKFFLGNGGNVLASTFRLPIHRFIEGGNGTSQMGQGHLSAVPLVLGNMGDEKTVQGVFSSVKVCLQHGCLLSPMASNLLLEGADNFVSKLYPLTIVELGPGFVIGKERLITTVAGPFKWPAQGGRLKLYRYSKEGARLPAEANVTVKAGQPLKLPVPEGGLVIAEL
jgi:hypothetical protein